VNGKRADGPANIKDGDEIQIGSIKLTFIDPASRILDQFGVLSKDEPEVVEPPPEGESEQAEDPADDPPPDDDPAPESDPPAPADDDPAPDGEESPEQPDLSDLPEPEPMKSGKAEIVILVVGGAFLLSAIAFGVFLFL
jgi:pSer/pThr/pTyr-binding forkhead associated (FHA) protein